MDDVFLFYYSAVDKPSSIQKWLRKEIQTKTPCRLMAMSGTGRLRLQDGVAELVKAREIYEFVSPDKHLARLEISTDNGEHWTVVNQAVATREP